MKKEEIRIILKKLITNDEFINQGFEYFATNRVENYDYYESEQQFIHIETGVTEGQHYLQSLVLRNFPPEIAQAHCSCQTFAEVHNCGHIAASIVEAIVRYDVFSSKVLQPSLTTTTEEQPTEQLFFVYPKLYIKQQDFNTYHLTINLHDNQSKTIIERANLPLLYGYYAPKIITSTTGIIKTANLNFSEEATFLEETIQTILTTTIKNKKAQITYTLDAYTLSELLEDIASKDLPLYYQGKERQTWQQMHIDYQYPQYLFTLDIPEVDTPQIFQKEYINLTVTPAYQSTPLPLCFTITDNIIKLFPKETRRCLISFLLTNTGEYLKEQKLRIPFHYMNQYLKKGEICHIPVQATSNLLQKIEYTPLQIEIQINKIEGGIQIDPYFIYGNTRIEALTYKYQNDTSLTYIDNDTEKEINFLNLLCQHLKIPTSVIKGKTHNFFEVFPEEAADDFIEHSMPKFVETGVVVLLDRALQIMYQQHFNVSLQIRWLDNGLLSYDLDTDFLAFEELQQIMRGYKTKNRYIILNNGAVLDKHNEKIAKKLQQLEKMDIDFATEDQTTLKEVPLYRALGLAAIGSNSQLTTKFDATTKTMLNDLKNPIPTPLGLPEHLKTIMRPYQLVGVYWLQQLTKYQLGGILADDMGLGKTLQVIAYLTTQTWDKPILIISPKTLIYNWANEFVKFAPELSTTIIDGTPYTREKALKNLNRTDIIITSYPLIIKDYQHYPEFSHVFIDEAQYMKNPETKLARTLSKINSTYRFALSGTPFENNLLELWSIFNFLMPGFFPNKKEFRKTIITPIHNRQDENTLQELKNKLQYVVLRRMKKDVLKELPDKIETQLYCELSDEQTKIYQYYFQQAQTTIREELARQGFAKSQIQILAILTRLRQVCTHPSMFLENYNGGSAKVELLQEVLTDALNAGHKILIFSQFTSMLEILEETLTQDNIPYYYLHGQTKAPERIRLVEAFNQKDNPVSVFLLSLKAGGTGLNLTAADIVIHFDPWWNPSVENQATDRAHRFGQQNTVQVFQFIAKNTIEEQIQKIKQKKQEMFNTLFNDEQTAFKQFSEKDIKVLLEIDE